MEDEAVNNYINEFKTKHGLSETEFECSFGIDYENCEEECKEGCEYSEQCLGCFEGIPDVLDSDENDEDDEEEASSVNSPEKPVPIKKETIVPGKPTQPIVVITPAIPSTTGKGISKNNKPALVAEIKEIIRNIYSDFRKLGHKLFEFKKIAGKGFFKECQELFGMKRDAAFNLVRTYEKFKAQEYDEMIPQIPYSGWVLLSKKSIEDDTVNKVMEEAKNNKTILSYENIKSLIKKHNPVPEIKSTDSKTSSFKDDTESPVEKLERMLLDAIKNSEVAEEQKKSISDTLNTAFSFIKKGNSEDVAKVA